MNLSFDSIDELNRFLRWAERFGATEVRQVASCDAMAEAVAAEDAQRPARAEVRPEGVASAIGAAYGLDVDEVLAEAGMTEDRTGLDINDPATDRDGVHYDDRIHAPSRSLKADGTWKAKRGVTADLVEQVLAEQRATRAEPEEGTEAPSDEVLVTETHPLPQDEPGDETEAAETEVAEAEPVVAPTGMSIDFPELVANAELLAQDLSGDMVKVLEASREFVKATSHEAFSALKVAVAPAEDGQGKALPSMNPGERRLLEAAMTLYMEQLKGE